MSKRAKFEEFVYRLVYEVSGIQQNVEFYKKKFATMSDKQMVQFAQDLRDKKHTISVVIPPSFKHSSLESVMKYGESIGHKYFERVHVSGRDGLPSYTSPIPMLILRVTARRAAQLLTKKISVPRNTRVRDLLTGQVTGESKGGTLSGPEQSHHAAMGTVLSAIELAKTRGGDAGAEAAMMRSLSQTGRATHAVVDQFGTGVKSVASFRSYMTAAWHRMKI